MGFWGWLSGKEKTKFTESAGTSVEAGWRKLGNEATDRDLKPISQDRMQKLAFAMWQRNLLSNRIIELPIAFMLAEGVSVTAQNEELQAVIAKFWDDPINNFDIKLVKKARQLALFGEQCYPVYVNEINGHVRLGYLDPVNIAQVVLDPDNGEQPIGVVTKKDKKGNYKKYRVIVNGNESIFTERTQAIRASDFTNGECFYFSVNDLSNGSRGRSDLLHIADWLKAYDEFMFGEFSRTDQKQSHIWDVTLVGADSAKVNERAAEITPPGAGDVIVHNDSEIWNPLSPSLNASDATISARLLRNHILSGATLPEHWLGGAGDTNRATAAEMDKPTLKVFTMRQTYLGYMIAEMVRFAIRQSVFALNANADEPDFNKPDFAFTVNMPEMANEDITRYGDTLQRMITSMSIAISDGLLTKKTAIELIGLIASRMGKEIDAAKELKAAELALAETQAAQDAADLYTEDAKNSEPVAA